MKRERAEVITDLVALFEGDSREEVTKIIEDVSDSWGESDETGSSITEEMYAELQGKYDNSVKAYRERFTQGSEKTEEKTEEKKEEKSEVKDYDELFEEKEK